MPSYIAKHWDTKKKDSKQELNAYVPTETASLKKALVHIPARGPSQRLHTARLDCFFRASIKKHFRQKFAYYALSHNVIPQEKPQDKPETWTILRDDFMLGADMKDWDKQDEDDETVNKDQ